MTRLSLGNVKYIFQSRRWGRNQTSLALTGRWGLISVKKNGGCATAGSGQFDGMAHRPHATQSAANAAGAGRGLRSPLGQYYTPGRSVQKPPALFGVPDYQRRTHCPVSARLSAHTNPQHGETNARSRSIRRHHWNHIFDPFVSERPLQLSNTAVGRRSPSPEEPTDVSISSTVPTPRSATPPRGVWF